jgi:DNA polymerase-3 subunit alpha (Gram-positive type)
MSLQEAEMNRKLSEFAEGKLSDGIAELKDTDLEAVRFFRQYNRVEIALHNEGPLSFHSYHELQERLHDLTGSSVMIHLDCDHDGISNAELKQYFDDLCQCKAEYQSIADTNFIYEENKNSLDFIFSDQESCERAGAYTEDISDYLDQIGIKGIHVTCSMMKAEHPDIKKVTMEILPEAPEEKPAFNSYQRKSSYRSKKESDYTAITLHEVTGDIYGIKFTADVFAKEEIETKKQTIIQNLSVYDGTDAIVIKRFEGRGTTREDLASINEGDRVTVFGRIAYDSFSKELVCQPDRIEKIEKKKETDDAPVKRVEWHMHTNMSEMDGICSPIEVVNTAFDLGLPGIVITDHADVQSLVKAFNTGEACKKKDPEHPFKVGLGCEMNMVDDRLLIVRNAIDKDIDDEEYVSFDLETTGLSCFYDSIIEFGAVKLKDQTVVDHLQMFIKPPFDIPAVITNKTNITNAMVKDAKPFSECIDQILDWIGNDTIVAHNATFDYHFLNEELRRIGRKPMTNCVIDTLDLSRAILRERRAYRLGNVARNYHVAYDEEVAHRADYDAESLSGVFLCLLKDAKDKYGCRTIRDLQEKTQDFQVYKKVRHSHICVVAKNQDGIRDLYRLVSESNTRTLAVMGKNAGKEGTDVAAEARILRSTLQKYRRNLMLGSACQNSEVWELACNGDDTRLEACMKFYDYIELQPLANYTTFVALGSVPSMNRVKDVQKRIIAMAQHLNIPIIADSDAHYLTKDQKIFRDIYIMSQGVGGVTHPLYIRDDMLRRKTPNPDQHLRTTNEMKQEFAWLEDPELIDQITVKNTIELFDKLDTVRPVPAGTFPPHIPDSDKKLRAICNKTAKDMYEFEGVIPSIVTDRLNMELNNIIKHGYDVHYYIAHLLVKKSNEDGYLVGSRGSVGSSFTATMSGITEVNPLKPHYLCPHCHYSEWIDDPEVKSGFDLPDKKCPKCGTVMHGNGQNIPFQTFLGFNADKVPDIDLNFSNEYQWRAHQFIKEVFGETHAFRAGTIGGVADKTAYGYVSGYCEKMGIEDMRRPMKDYLAKGCTDVKRTTGQHPGGIIIIPDGYEAEDFTPVQFPANDPTSPWKTTHYDFHDIHDNVLKFDILGHVDPTAMRMLQRIADVKPLDIPMNDPETLSLFYEDTALHADPRIYKKTTGAVGLPEFGTRTTRRVLEETKPHKFSELVMISGLSHGTDVWAGNAEALVQAGHPLGETIACRDDIMTYLLEKKLEPIDAFKTMEDVRKGRGLREDQEENMKAHHVPDWYIESCKKIKYMFPKAHAVAYVMMALRIAWYKVHEPMHFYIQYLTLRCGAYEIETMVKGIEAIRARMQDIEMRAQDKNSANPVTNKEKSLLDTLEICEEIYARGYQISNVNLYKSLADEFTVDPDNPKALIPPFTVIDGLGAGVASSVVEAAKQAEFLSKEDLEKRTQLSGTLIKKLDMMGVLNGLSDRNQMSLF